MNLSSLRAISTGTQPERIEALRSLLGYPIRERDVSGSRYWYLRPGVDRSETEDTCLIAVDSYAECDRFCKCFLRLDYWVLDEVVSFDFKDYALRVFPSGRCANK